MKLCDLIIEILNNALKFNTKLKWLMRIEMIKVWVVSLNTYINCCIYMLPSVNKCKLNAIIFSKLYIYKVWIRFDIILLLIFWYLNDVTE